MADGRVDQTLDQVQLFPLIDALRPLSLLTTQQADDTKPLHHFVRGLIFSATLLDLIRNILPNGHHAGWAQITDAEGNLLSPENDIVIYTGQPRHRWRTSSFEYSVIGSTDAKAVIQCRALVRSVGKDLSGYAKEVRRFCGHVWLFAECCWAKTAERRQEIARDAKEAGYAHFFYLYDFDRNNAVTPNLSGWRDFKSALAKVCRPTRRRTPRRRR